MSAQELCKITIENTTLEVPVIKTPEHTQQLGDMVTERMNRIASERRTFNTFHFALQAAVELADELLEERRGREADDQQLVRACHRITEKLRSLSAAYELAPEETSGQE